MVNIQSAQLDLIFHALADSTRRRILEMLGGGARTVGELAAPFKMSLAAVSKHIKVLEGASLLKRTRDGRVHHCALEEASFATAEECIRYYQKFWERRLEAFGEALEQEEQEKREEKEKRNVRSRKK